MIQPSRAVGELRDVKAPDLRAFMAQYFATDAIKVRPPQENILLYRGVTSVVLYREGQFQVELIVVEPGVHIPLHCHDDVESFEVAFSGGINLEIDGKAASAIREPRANGMMRDFGRYVPIPSDAPHGGTAGPQGACFLSVQRWRDGVPPTHVGLNWRGVRMEQR